MGPHGETEIEKGAVRLGDGAGDMTMMIGMIGTIAIVSVTASVTGIATGIAREIGTGKETGTETEIASTGTTTGTALDMLHRGMTAIAIAEIGPGLGTGTAIGTVTRTGEEGTSSDIDHDAGILRSDNRPGFWPEQGREITGFIMICTYLTYLILKEAFCTYSTKITYRHIQKGQDGDFFQRGQSKMIICLGNCVCMTFVTVIM